MPITTIAYHGGAGGSKSSWATDFKFENCWHAARRQAKKDACASVKKELHRSIKLNELKKGKAWESWWYLVINCNNWLLPATIYFAIFYCNIFYCRLRNVMSL